VELDLNALARRGAEGRLQEMRDELSAFRQRFGAAFVLEHFGDVTAPGAAPGGKAPALAERHKARRMTPAQRKAVSKRMSAYWAAKRKGKK
jgi:hypothetical protein